MENPYANLQPNNAGNAFMQAFQQGAQQRRESDTQNALARYAQNPDDPQVFSEMARLNPQLAIQLRGQQQQQHAAALEQHRDSIIAGAKIFRQLNVHDEQTYQQALAMGRQYGLDLTEVPPNFDPQYVNGVVKLADAFAPQKQNSAPSSVQEYEYAKSQGFQGSYMDFEDAKRGPMLANNGDGTFLLIPRSSQMGQNLGNPAPQGVTFTPIDGGPTPQASGAFPR